MGLTKTLSSPYFGGSEGSTALVPGKYPIGLGGLAFLLDDNLTADFKHETIPLLKSQQDQQPNVSARSLNPDALWRRSIDSWHKGEGQEFNREDADSDSIVDRYSYGQGVDPWTEGQLTLLPDTAQKRASANSNLRMLVTGTRVWLLDDINIRFTDDIEASTPVWTAVTGAPGGSILDFTTDGFHIYAITATNLYRFDATVGSPAFGATWLATGFSLISYVNGRLLTVGTGGNSHIIYEISNTPTATVIYTHFNSNFTWVDFTEGNNAIYAAGKLDDKSYIFQIVIEEDGSGLGAVLQTATPPDGEIVQSLGNYVGFVFVGTNKGCRFALPDSSGRLSLGALLATNKNCSAFEGQGDYVWFGWTNFGAAATGMGRMDMTTFTFTELLAPAYASDLMAADVNGECQAIVTVDGVQYFSINGEGVYGPSANKVSTGYFVASKTDFGLPDNKLAQYLDVAHNSVGQHSLFFASDDGVSTLIATHTDETSPFNLNRVEGNSFLYSIVMNRDTTDATLGPTIYSVTLRAQPLAKPGKFIFVPLLLHSREYSGMSEAARSPASDYNAIDDWRKSKTPIQYQEGDLSFLVHVDDFVWLPYLTLDTAKGKWVTAGTCIVKLKVLVE